MLWATAGGLGPCHTDLSKQLLEPLHNVSVGLPQSKIQNREGWGSCNTFSDLALEQIPYHFCYLLLAKVSFQVLPTFKGKE